MTSRLQVIEPTLDSYAGHCYSLVASLCRSIQMPIDVWVAKGASALDFGDNVSAHTYFHRRMRILQQLGLYRRLLKQSDPLIVTTARRSDLLILDLVSQGVLPENRVFVYFHWIRESEKRLTFLRKIARRLPNIVVFGTTQSVVDYFRRAGFCYVFLLPYPSTAPRSVVMTPIFRRLLYAGAARRDKGFRQVVDLVELLARNRENIPIAVQVSAEHLGKYDSDTRADISRLRRSGYACLEIIEKTLTPEEYAALFPGSICLQPYDRLDFRDRTSGVTLDALAAGCPVITMSETWMSAQIGITNAGVALSKSDAPTLYSAAKTIMARYAEYSVAARKAGEVRERESWTVVSDLLRQ